MAAALLLSTLAAGMCCRVCFTEEGVPREQLGVIIQYACTTAVTLPHTNRLRLITAAAAVSSPVQAQQPRGALLPQCYRPWQQAVWLACLFWWDAAGARQGRQGVGAAAAAALAGAHEGKGRPQPLAPARAVQANTTPCMSQACSSVSKLEVILEVCVQLT